MDPVTIAIIGALAVGANKVGECLLPDAYEGLKALIKRKFGEDGRLAKAVEALEAEPKFKPNQATLEGRVAEAKADEDEEVVSAARALISELERIRDKEPAGAGVVLRDILSRAGAVRLDDKTGRGALGEHIDAYGDVTATSESSSIERDPKA